MGIPLLLSILLAALSPSALLQRAEPIIFSSSGPSPLENDSVGSLRDICVNALLQAGQLALWESFQMGEEASLGRNDGVQLWSLLLPQVSKRLRDSGVGLEFWLHLMSLPSHFLVRLREKLGSQSKQMRLRTLSEESESHSSPWLLVLGLPS